MQYVRGFSRACALTCSWLAMQLVTLVPTQAQQPQTTTLPPAISAVCTSQLPATIDRIIDRPQLQRYQWGIVVRTVNGAQLYNRNGDRLFTPASNVKLITTAVALRQLGAGSRLRTSVYQLPSTGNATNLLVVGRGDPTLTVASLQSIAQQLEQRGITKIGKIDFDDGYFRGEPIHGDWEWGDLTLDYAAAINGLMINQNSNPLTLRPQQVGMPLKYAWKEPLLTTWQLDDRTQTVATGGINNANANAIFGKPTLLLSGKVALNSAPFQIDLPLLNPAAAFSNAFRYSLVTNGMRIERMNIISERDLTNLPELAAITSPTIAELIVETNQRSNNVYAEVLLKSIGRTNLDYLTSSADATSLGIDLVKKNLAAMGIEPQAYRLKDGSGLSRHNLVAPTTLVRVLSSMSASSFAETYRNSLPLAGVSGSLKNRFKGTIASGLVRAKTGTLSGVMSLSGYINPPQYQPLVFSIMLDRHDRPSSEMVKIIDEIVVELAKLKQC